MTNKTLDYIKKDSDLVSSIMNRKDIDTKEKLQLIDCLLNKASKDLK